MRPVLRRSSGLRAAALLGLILLVSITAHAQSDDIAAIKGLNEAWIHSYMTKDTATAGRVWADDFVLINPQGKRFTKQDGISNMASPATHFISTHVDTAEVKVVGNLGYIHARASFVSTDEHGNQIKGSTDYLDVYEKRKGGWVCIAAHVIYLGDQ